MHEGQDQADLLPAAFGQFAHRTIGHDLEPVGQLLDSGVVNAAAGAAEPGNVLAAGQARGQFKVAGKVAGPAMDLDAVSGGIKPQEGGPAPRRPLQCQQHADGGGLPRPVRAEEPEDLPWLNPQAEVGNRGGGAVSLGQPDRLNRGCHLSAPR